jgi:hypothetical protein
MQARQPDCSLVALLSPSLHQVLTCHRCTAGAHGLNPYAWPQLGATGVQAHHAAEAYASSMAHEQQRRVIAQR